MPENTNVVEEQVVETAKDAVVEAVNNNSSLTGILIGVTGALVVAGVCWGGAKLYKNHKNKKAMTAKLPEVDYDEDYEYEEDEDEAK